MTSKAVRIMLADDHPILRAGLSTMINTQPDMVVVAEANNGQQAVEMYHEYQPDVTLMDLSMPGMSGIEAVVAIRRQSPAARIIVLTNYDGDENIYRAIEAGARSYLLKTMHQSEVIEAIRIVHGGQRQIPPIVATVLFERKPNTQLTSREIDVLKLIGKGMSNKEIANVLRLTDNTVRFHIRGIMSKLEVNDRTQAVTTALRRGIISLDE